MCRIKGTINSSQTALADWAPSRAVITMSITHLAGSPAAPYPALGEPRIGRGLPSGRVPIDVKVFLLAVFMVSVQIETGGLSRLSPTDMLLAGLLLVSPGLFRLRATAVDLLPVGLLVVLSAGTLWAMMWSGNATNHTVTVKLAGGFVLALLAIVTARYARDGWTDHIVMSFLAGMTVWGVIAYIDWKFANIVPFLEAKTPTRFGAMQFDPNNAGAGYGVAVVLAWRMGPHVFRRRITSLVVLLVCCAALGFTLSRGGYIATVVGGGVVVIIERRSMQKSLRLAIAIGLIVIGAIATGIVATAIDDFNNRPDNIEGRTSIVENGVSDFVSSGGLGIGLGAYNEQYSAIIHNTALWFLVEMSLWGVAFLLLMGFVPAQAALRLRRSDPSLGSALLAGHLVMLVASAGIEALYQRPWWIVVGLIAGSAARQADRAAALSSA